MGRRRHSAQLAIWLPLWAAATLAAAVGCGGGSNTGPGAPGRTKTWALTDLQPKLATQSEAFGVNAAQAAGYAVVGGRNHAILWPSLAAASAVDLNGSFTDSEAYGVFDSVVVGYATVGGAKHAIMWPGGASDPDDVSPPQGYNGLSWSESAATGIGGSQTVGYGAPSSGGTHALLWPPAPPESLVDLHPATGYSSTYAYGADGTHQVGYGQTTSGVNHALVWSGSPDSVVDLHPANGFSGQNWTKSTALCVSGNQIVGAGVGSADRQSHALLWTAPFGANAANLSPPGFTASELLGTNGTQQVGDGTDASGHKHALLWTGSPSSAVDLNGYLTSGFTQSVATGVDAAGNIVGAATNGATGSANTTQAVVWIPVERGYRMVTRR